MANGFKKRNRFTGLSYSVTIDLYPLSKSGFLFCGGKSNRFKAFYWDGEGFWVFYKRFEK
ncbi:transposase [Enterococcus columbae]|uniref:transposase n=1 Tax=Enterococcus columbae TaxID=1355 RepID=UPI0009168090|nr:transposase [Enterococcus columbae]OJG25108.1 transposase [Enterococcus columbae DSM 7374 = ATCC 51263]